MTNDVQLIANITPERCPELSETVRVCNKKVVSIRGGSIIFYVTPLFVVMVKRVLEPDLSRDKDLEKFKTNTFVTEIKVPIETLLV